MPNKYNQIMERITVSPEMKERLLANIADETVQEQKRPFNFRKYWIKHRQVFYTAACVLVLTVGGISAYYSLNTNSLTSPTEIGDGPPVLGTAPMEYPSIKELEARVGFKVKQVSEFPFDVEQVVFSSIDGESAQIQYSNENQYLSFRMSPNSDNPSGDYNDYPETQVVQQKNASITLKGKPGSFVLAVWKDRDWGYSIQLSQGVTEEQFLTIINSIQ